MKTIEDMRALRDLAGSLPALLNPLLDAGHSLAYPRFFVFVDDGFGHYPRFNDWSDVSDRISAFREAIDKVRNVWVRFLAWWSNATGDKKITAELQGDLSRITGARLYELLLTVMLNTPATWGDRIYWLLHRQKNLPVRPCLAKWKKDEPQTPWHVTVEGFVAGNVVEIGRSDLTTGCLPDNAVELAPIFWEYLYPLCNRESYTPPQNAAKYATGAIHELILPVSDGKSGHPIGWAVCHVQTSSDSRTLLASLTLAPIAEMLKDFEGRVRATTQNE